MAEGVGLLPTIGKTLEIKGRFPRDVSQDYRTSVPLDKGEFFHSELGRLGKRGIGVFGF